MELFRILVNVLFTSGGGVSLLNAGLVPLLFFLWSLKSTGKTVLNSRGPFEDPALSIAIKLLLYMTLACVGALLAFGVTVAVFSSYPQFFAMESLFQIEESGITIKGYTIFNQAILLWAVYALVLKLYSTVVKKSSLQPEGPGMGRAEGWLLFWPDRLFLGFILLFSLVVRVPAVLYKVTLNYETANLLYGLFFQIILLGLIRTVVLLFATLLVAPGCRKRAAEAPLKGSTPLERFKHRARRKIRARFTLGLISLLLMTFVMAVISNESWVYSGEAALERGIGQYGDKLLRFKDAEIVYIKRGYLTTAQGKAAEDLYIAEVSEGIYLAVYVESEEQRDLEMGTGNLVIGRVQPYRDGPERKFREVAETLGIDADEVVLLGHPIKYRTSKSIYGMYGVYGLLILLPFFLLGITAVSYINPLNIRSLHKLGMSDGERDRMLSQLELELETGEKIYHQGDAFSRGSFITENFYFMEAVGVLQVVPLREILTIGSVAYGKYNSCTIVLLLRNGKKVMLTVPPGVEQPLRQRLEAINGRI